jgi:hypothetical protein
MPAAALGSGSIGSARRRRALLLFSVFGVFRCPKTNPANPLRAFEWRVEVEVYGVSTRALR